jgi:hypothetical protein
MRGTGNFFKEAKNLAKLWRYRSLIFTPIKMNEEKLEYILSGIDPKLRREYSIVYSPTNLTLFKSGKNKQKSFFSFPERDVSYDFNWSYQEAINSPNPCEYIKKMKKEIKEKHKKVMENMRLNHLKNMTNFFSNKILNTVGSLEDKLKINLKVDFEKGLQVSYWNY